MEKEYKQYDMLSSYAISEDGEVIELDTLETVELVHDPVRKSLLNYKLLTDEEVYLEIKDKTIKLWRRFTVDEVKKMFRSDRAKLIDLDVDISVANVPVDGTSSVPLKENAQIECTTTESVPVERGKSVPLLINGIVYQSLREACTNLQLHRNTVKKRLDDPLNSDYTYID